MGTQAQDVEASARASWECGLSHVTWEELPEHMRTDYRHRAKAAIITYLTLLTEKSTP